ncbi:muscleblind-like protein 3 isoform X1 [Achroia grisella]|uniref:muscleblind-like protein 3 isoform X1 n=1 Tax=Achroia grisella TaxID=688607 RepID=UPI0027D2E93F|nr:muscleblind-like protein 3 isoform X1 [Achroia grisella]
MSSGASSEMLPGGANSINFKPSPNFKHMKKYLKSKFEEEDKVASTSSVPSGSASTSMSNKILENDSKVKMTVQPPLPPNSPPPDNPLNFKLKTEVVDDTYEVSTEKKPNMEQTGEYSIEFESAEKPKKTMCKDFIRGTCKRGETCIYAHVLDLAQLKGVYKFCRDYANGKCKRAMCFFVHATTFEKESFFRTGYLPPHTLSHLKEGNVIRPHSLPEGPSREVMHPVYPSPPTEMQAGGGIPTVPTISVPKTSVVNPKLPQDVYQTTAPSMRSTLKRDWSDGAAVPPPVLENTEQPVYKKCLNCELHKLRYQQNQAKKDTLIKSTKTLDENIAKLLKKKNWLTTVLKVILSCPDTYNNSDISA